MSVFKTSGEFVTSFGQFRECEGIIIDHDGFAYVSNSELNGNITVL